MCLGPAIIFDTVNVYGPDRTLWLCPAMTKGKRNRRVPENKASTAPGALREIPDYHSSGNKTETAGSASDYN